MRRWGDIGKKSVDPSAQAIAGYDCVLVSTNHSAIDWPMVAQHAKLVIDTRNALDGLGGNVVKA
jgi:UDP-N-acetyl-D-glucosamine dehydrogenase